MKAWQLVCAGVGAALSASTPASAQPTNDLKCLLASNLYSIAAKDEKMRKLAEANKYYYLGRVSTHLNEQQIRGQMQAQGKTITQANAGSVMQACVGQMRKAAATIERVGKQMAPRKK